MIELPRLDASSPNQIPPHGNVEVSDQSHEATNFKAKALKGLIALSCIASAAFFASSSRNVASFNEEPVESSMAAVEGPHFDLNTMEPVKFHQSGFGALNFHHHEDAPRKFRRFLSEANVVVPKSAVPHAIPSLAEPNIINLHGHYVHDESRSPWSSLSYKRSKEELKQEQDEYLEKMKKVKQEWGSWNFKDEAEVVRPIQDFSQTEYKDLMNSEFQSNVWQTDEKYVKDFRNH